jgi:hypothetical protein
MVPGAKQDQDLIVGQHVFIVARFAYIKFTILALGEYIGLLDPFVETEFAITSFFGRGNEPMLVIF